MAESQGDYAVGWDPISKETVVPLAASEAFVLFTAGIAAWWPLETHSVGGKDARGVVFEQHAGGRIYEIGEDGEETLWGRVKEFDPPRGVSFSWHPGRQPGTAQTVEVRFERVPGGTHVRLDHWGWERLGGDAIEIRARYVSGWDLVLEGFVRASATP